MLDCQESINTNQFLGKIRHCFLCWPTLQLRFDFMFYLHLFLEAATAASDDLDFPQSKSIQFSVAILAGTIGSSRDRCIYSCAAQHRLEMYELLTLACRYPNLWNGLLELNQPVALPEAFSGTTHWLA